MSQDNIHPNRSARSFRAIPTTGVTAFPRMFGGRGAVASHHYSSALAGIDILKSGGTAADAAAAATLVEGVVNQQMHSIGGELPILIADPRSGKIVSINGNTIAPKAAMPERYRALGHATVPPEGVLSAGVPSALGAIVTALLHFGTMSFADVSARAIELARDGFSAHAGLLRQHKFGIRDNREKFLTQWRGSAAVYLKPDGAMPQEGELIRNSALAGMFDYLVEAERKAGGSREDGLRAVWEAFYKGDVAREIVAFSERNGGLLAMEDFAAFTVPLEAPIATTLGDAAIYKCGPWNQGAALIQSLTILKTFDLKTIGHNSAEYIHLVTEAMKLAFADREQYYGDPDFIKVPLDTLISDEYGARRAALISDRADMEMRPGDGWSGAALLPHEQRMGGRAWGPGTVHVDAGDSEGMLCAFTPSGGWIKSSEVMPALGFPLSMRIGNFYLEPAHHPNLIAPHKRPCTTISPSLAVKDGKPWMAFGSMGGDQQDQWQLQFFLNRALFDMPLQKAIEAPKFSSEHFPGLFAPHDFFLNRLRIEPEVGADVLDGLRARGHDVDVGPSWSEGFMCAVERHDALGVFEAGADPRGTKSEVFPGTALAI